MEPFHLQRQAIMEYLVCMCLTNCFPQKYLLPYLKAPEQTQYEADVSVLNSQFDLIEQKLKDIQADCETTRSIAERQQDRISTLVNNVETNLTVVRENDRKNRDELREIREEVDIIREMLPKVGSVMHAKGIILMRIK